jgi:uncharacterized membrane protein
MSFLFWPVGYVVVGALLGVLVAPATQSDGRERREIMAMFVMAWPLIGAITIAIHCALMLRSYWPSWPSALRWLGWARLLSGEEWPL